MMPLSLSYQSTQNTNATSGNMGSSIGGYQEGARVMVSGSNPGGGLMNAVLAMMGPSENGGLYLNGQAGIDPATGMSSTTLLIIAGAGLVALFLWKKK